MGTRVRSARGAATAELAMVLPLLVAVSIGLVWLLAVGAAQVRVVDAARETARALARGDDEATAVGRGLDVAPAGSRVAVEDLVGHRARPARDARRAAVVRDRRRRLGGDARAGQDDRPPVPQHRGQALDRRLQLVRAGGRRQLAGGGERGHARR